MLFVSSQLFHRSGIETIGRIDNECVHLLFLQHRIERVGQLDLAAHAGLDIGQKLHDARAQKVPPEHREVRRRIFERWLLDKRIDLPHARGNLGTRNNAEPADLVVGHGHDGDHARPRMLVRYLLHARKHCVIGYEDIAQEHVERFVSRLFPPRSGWHGPSRAVRPDTRSSH